MDEGDRARLADAARRAIREHRREIAHPWLTWPRRAGSELARTAAGTAVRCRELPAKLGEGVLGAAADLIVSLAALAMLAGVVSAVGWGWDRSRAATALLIAATVLFLGYGVIVARLPAERRRGRLAATAVGAVTFVGVWMAELFFNLGPALRILF